MIYPRLRIRVPRRGAAWIGVLVLASAAVGLARLPRSGDPGPNDSGRPDREARHGSRPRTVPADTEAEPRGSARRTLGPRGTLAGTLDRLGVASGLRRPLLESVGAHVDLRRLAAETEVLVRADRSGAWSSLVLRPEAGRLVEVRIGADGSLDTQWIDLPIETEVRIATGIVVDSVAQALSDSPHGRLVTPAFADIFQWDVDLLVDPRPGDRVRVVYEVRTLGAVPDDLPTFGRAATRPGELVGIGRILAASYAGRLASANAFWVEKGTGGDYYDLEGRPLRKTFLKSPLNYRRISSRFSRARRNPVTRRVVPHHGVDYAARSGTPVVAAADGRVASVGWEGALGRTVRVRHGSEYVTVYGHLRAAARGLRRGAEVRQNQVIGYVGATGRATGPHLHYTVTHRGRPIDPLRMKNPPVERLDPSLLSSLDLAIRRWRPMIDAELDPRLALAERRVGDAL